MLLSDWFSQGHLALADPIRSLQPELAELLAGDPEADVVIDLEAMQVTCANNVLDVTMKESAREAFLAAAYDPLDELLSGMDDVAGVAARL